MDDEIAANLLCEDIVMESDVDGGKLAESEALAGMP